MNFSLHNVCYRTELDIFPFILPDNDKYYFIGPMIRKLRQKTVCLFENLRQAQIKMCNLLFVLQIQDLFLFSTRALCGSFYEKRKQRRKFKNTNAYLAQRYNSFVFGCFFKTNGNRFETTIKLLFIFGSLGVIVISVVSTIFQRIKLFSTKFRKI